MTTTTTLPPGRALDERIAERVLGWVPVLHYGKRGTGFWAPSGCESDGPYLTDEEIHHFSTDIAAAWTLGAALRARPDGWRFNLHVVEYAYGRTYAYFGADPDGVAWSEGNGEHATPHAICLAALAAVESAHA